MSKYVNVSITPQAAERLRDASAYLSGYLRRRVTLSETVIIAARHMDLATLNPDGKKPKAAK